MSRRRWLSILMVIIVLCSNVNSGLIVLASELYDYISSYGVENPIDISFSFDEAAPGFSDKERPIESTGTTSLKMRVTLNPKFIKGRAENIKVHIKLPYVEVDDYGKTYQYWDDEYPPVTDGSFMPMLQEDLLLDDELIQEPKQPDTTDDSDNKGDGSEDNNEPQEPSDNDGSDDQNNNKPSDNEEPTLPDENEAEPEIKEPSEPSSEIEEPSEENHNTETEIPPEQEDMVQAFSIPSSGGAIAPDPVEPEDDNPSDIDLEAVSGAAFGMKMLTKSNGVGVNNIIGDSAWKLPVSELPYKGNIVIERLSLDAGSMPSFELELLFYGDDIVEDVVADIKGWVEYDYFDGDAQHWETPGQQTDDAIVRVVNTSLRWNSVVENKQGPKPTVIWDRFNYVPFDFTITNISENDFSILDRFSMHFAAPYIGEEYHPDGYIGGMTDVDAYLWEHTALGTHYNSALVKKDGHKYIGNTKDGGGILIFDITDEAVDLPTNEFPNSEPMEYTYTGAGEFTVRLTEGDIKLYPQMSSEAQGGKLSSRKYRVYIPFDNRFQDGKLPHTFNLKVQPTVWIGDKDRYVLWTKDNNADFNLDAPDKKPIEFRKTADADGKFKGYGNFYIDQIHNQANNPYFDLVLEDNMPAGFDLYTVTYEIDWDKEGKPDLKDYLDLSDPILTFNYTHTNWCKTSRKTDYYTVRASDFVGSYSNGKYKWTINIWNIIKSLTQGRYNVHFGGYIRINLTDRLNGYATMPGRFTLGGYYNITGRVENVAQITYKYKYHEGPEAYKAGDLAYKPNYKIENKGPVYSQAHVDIDGPQPKITVKAYSGSEDKWGDDLHVPYGGFDKTEPENGYYYYLGNNADAPMEPADLYITLPVTQTPGLKYLRKGFRANDLIISKDIWKVANKYKEENGKELIKYIEFMQIEPGDIRTRYIVKGKDLRNYVERGDGVNNEGDITIHKGGRLWPTYMEFPTYITIHFEHFPENIGDAAMKEFFVAVKGDAAAYGYLTSNAKWNCDITEEITPSVTGKNTLIVDRPDPSLIVKSWNTELGVGDNLAVPYDGFEPSEPQSGYKYYVGNNSISPLKPGNLTINLEVYEKTLTGIVRRNGFTARKLIISNELWKMFESMKTNEDKYFIEKIDIIQDVDDNNILFHRITGADLWNEADGGNNVTADGLILDEDIWTASGIDTPNRLEIKFREMPRKMGQPMAKDLYIGLLGNTTRFGSLTSKAKWGAELEGEEIGVYTESKNTLAVAEPKPVIDMKSYNVQTRETGKKISVSYDGFAERPANSGYNYYPENHAASSMKAGTLQIKLPVDDGTTTVGVRNGFNAKEIIISRNLMRIADAIKTSTNVDMISKIELIEKNNNTVITIDGSELANYLVTDGTSSNYGAVVIPKGSAVWDANILNHPDRINIYLTSFPSNQRESESKDIYIRVLGNVTSYGVLKSTAEWSCEIESDTNPSSEAYSEIDVVKPKPSVTIESTDESQPLKGDNINVSYDGMDDITPAKGYRYYLDNDSITKMIENTLVITIPTDRATAEYNRRNGLSVKTLVLSKELWKLVKDFKDTYNEDLVKEIVLTQIGVSDVVTFSGSQLASYLDNNSGNIVINEGDGDWTAGIFDHLDKVEVIFNEYPAQIKNAKAKNIYFAVLGNTTRYGSLTTTALWECAITINETVKSEAFNYLNVMKPAPKVTVKARDELNQATGDNLQVSFDGDEGEEASSGFHYFIDNPSITKMKPANLLINLPVTAETTGAVTDKKGLYAKKLVISKELWAIGEDILDKNNFNMIEKITINQKNPVDQIVIDGAVLQDYLVTDSTSSFKGCIVIPEGSMAWPTGLDHPTSIEISFRMFPAKISNAQTKGIYVSVLGWTTNYGKLESSAVWNTMIDLKNTESNSHNNTLEVVQPSPYLKIRAMDNVLGIVGDNLTVPYSGFGNMKSRSGFYYYIENQSITYIKPGTLDIEVQAEGPLGSLTARQGLLAQQFIISPELWRIMKTMKTETGIDMINKIEFINDSAGATRQFELNGADLAAYAVNDSSSIFNRHVLVDKSVWGGGVDSPNRVKIHFNRIPPSIWESEEKGIYFGIIGNTNKYGTLQSTGTFSVTVTGESDKDSTSTNNLYVQQPDPQVYVKAYDDNKQLIGDKLMVPYDDYEDYDTKPAKSGFRYYLDNNSISNTDTGKLRINIQVVKPTSATDNRRNGLLSKQFIISKELSQLIDNVRRNDNMDMISHIVYIQEGNEYKVEWNILKEKMSYGGSGVVNGPLVFNRGDTVLVDGVMQQLWPNEFDSVDAIEIYFNTFPASVANAVSNNIYIGILGNTTRYGALDSHALWNNKISPTSSKNSKSDNTIIVVKPEPITYIYSYHGGTKVIRSLEASQPDNYLEVPYDGTEGPSTNSGYRYYIGNNTSSSMKTAELVMNIPVKHPVDGTINNTKDRNGLITENIVISKVLWQKARALKTERGISLIKEIELIENRASNIPISYTIDGADIEAMGIINGDVVIEKGTSIWPITDPINHVFSPDKIIVHFNAFPGEIKEPVSDQVYIAALGRTTRYGYIDSTSGFRSSIMHHEDAVMEGNNKLYVTKPAPQMVTYAEYGGLSNQKATYDSSLAKNIGWTVLPYGRIGNYVFELYNTTATPVPYGELVLDFTVKPINSSDESGRGYRLKEFRMPKTLLEVFKFDKLVVTDSDNGINYIKKFPDGYYFTDATFTMKHIPIPLEDNGDFVLTMDKLSPLKNVNKMTFNIVHFNGTVPRNRNYAITTKGYVDSEPYRSSSTYNLSNVTSATNFTTAAWNTLINEDEWLKKRDQSGFRPMAAFIDYHMYAKIGNTNGYTNSTTRFDEYEYSQPPKNESSTYYYAENKYMDVGYKSLGSFVSGIQQLKAYEANVKMTLNIEVKLQYNDFDLYYIKLHPMLKDRMDENEAVKIYRLDENNVEQLWYTVKQSDWTNNGKDLSGAASSAALPWFRINTAKVSNPADGKMFSNASMSTDADNFEHAYYRSPRHSDGINQQVTRVVFKIHLNQKELDSSGIRNIPDLDQADDLIHLTGRFYRHVGEVSAESIISYDFGEEESLRAGLTPETVLIGSIKTVDKMVQYYAKNTGMLGNLDRWGTSRTKAHFYVHEPMPEVRKGVDNDEGTVPELKTQAAATSTTYPEEQIPLVGTPKKFLIGFWNEVTTKSNGNTNDRKNEWSGKKVFADQFRIVDDLPALTAVSDEANQFEGFITDTIKFKEDGLTYKYFKDFASIELQINTGSVAKRRVVFDKDDFVDGIMQINIIYPESGTSPSGKTGVDLVLEYGEYVKAYTFNVKNLNGHGDNASEYSGVTAENYYLDNYKPALEVQGRIWSLKDQVNKVTVTVPYNDSQQSSNTTYDYARMKGLPYELNGNLRVTHNVRGRNQYIYSPMPGELDQPNVMDFYFNISNPVRTGLQPKTGIAKVEIVTPNLKGFQPQEIKIPKELFNGDIWEFSKFMMGTQEMVNEFVLIGDMYVLDVEGRGKYTNEQGYSVYYAGGPSITAEIRVKNMNNRTDYLGEGQELSALNDITISGIFAKKLVGTSVWDRSSAVTIAGDEWTFNHEFTNSATNTVLNTGSNTMFSSPARTQKTNTNFPFEVRNLAAKINFTYIQDKAFDKHSEETIIDDNNIMPGDRFKLRLVMENVGDPADPMDGLTLLDEPMMRYRILEGVRFISWELVGSESSIDPSEITCKDITVVTAPNTIDMGVDYNTITPFVRDIVWTSSGRLDKGQKVVVDMVMEYTDEKANNMVYPQMYQGKPIESQGEFTVSGGKTHGFYPFLYGERSNVLPLPEEDDNEEEIIQRGKVSIDPTIGLTSLNGAKRTDMTERLMADTKPLSVKTEAALTYNGYPDNITGYPLIITVGDIANHTKHEDTTLKVEVILDNRTDGLNGIELTSWPHISYPADFLEAEFSEPKLSYKLSNSSSPWIPVQPGDVLDPAIADKIYALQWEYGKLPAYNSSGKLLKLDDIKIYGIGYWRSSNPATDNNFYYTLRTTANTYYGHNPHEYNNGDEIVIGKSTNYYYNIYKERPLVELDTQAFDEKQDAEAKYQASNPKRKTSYRPDESFWYKIILKNKARDSKFYNDAGTGPLKEPVIIDKVPEYAVPALEIPSVTSGSAIDVSGAIASGDLSIVWYDKDNNPKAYNMPEVTVRLVEDYDVGGAQYIANYPYKNTVVGDTALYKTNSRKIKFYVYEYAFDQDLERDERIEIQYRVKSRIENLPQMYYIRNGEVYPTYLPRNGEYADVTGYQYPNYSKMAHHLAEGLEAVDMDGDFLIHDVGATGIPNFGTPEAYFLNNSLSWMPGYDDSSNTNQKFSEKVSGENGDLFDYDLKTSMIQQTEMKISGGIIDKYVSSRYNSYVSNLTRDMWRLVLKPRTEILSDTLGLDYNTVWAQSRLHLARTWLYANSEMIPKDKELRYELDKNTYTKEKYTYGAEPGDVYTARQRAVNYGDYHVNGLEILYVLPRGTEPLMSGGNPEIKAYYGDPNGVIEAINDFTYEIIQKPDEPAQTAFYAPKALMAAKGANGSYFLQSEANSIPWVIRITVNKPLTAWWNLKNSLKSASGSIKGYSIFTDIKVRVLEANADGNWYDEVYISAIDDETKNYLRIYDTAYSETPASIPVIRGETVQSGSLKASETGKELSDWDGMTTDTDFNQIVEEKLYAHNGDKLQSRKPTIRMWADVENADTKDFFHETEEDPFELNIHVYNRYEWAENPMPRSINDPEHIMYSEKYKYNHQTDKGMKGSYLEPVIHNILPNGVVPVDTNGDSLPRDGALWVDDGTRKIDFTITGIPYNENNWEVKTKFLKTDAHGTPINRYQLTFIPKDYDDIDDQVRILYNEHMQIKVKVQTIAWPDIVTTDPYGVTKESAELAERWQYNRTYASSKKEIFLFNVEPDNSPYKVGSQKRSGVASDNRPDIQGAKDRIKAYALGKLEIGRERDPINIEDYRNRKELILTSQQKDFNFNGRDQTNPADDNTTILTDEYVTNTMTLFTKHPRLVVDKTVARKEETLKDEDTLAVSYGNAFWYNLTFKNAPVPITNPNSVENLQRHESTKGTLQSSYINFNDWLPNKDLTNKIFVSYEDYRIQYQNPNHPSQMITLNNTDALASGWGVTKVTKPSQPAYIGFQIKTSADYMESGEMNAKAGNLRSGEAFTLKLNTRITDTELMDKYPDIPWGPYVNNVYANTTSFALQQDKQPNYFNEYIVAVNEQTRKADYNLDGDQDDEYATDKANIKIKKPKGYIRLDTVVNRTKFTNGVLDNPKFSSHKEITFMLDEVQSTGADVPELIIQMNGLSLNRYDKRTMINELEVATHRITTGKWAVPDGYDPDDYKIYVYYSLANEQFSSFGDRNQWKPINTEGVPLTENREITELQNISDAVNKKITKIIYVIRSDDPEKNPVPAGICIDSDADYDKPDRQTVSDVDKAKQNLNRFTESVYDNSPKVTYKAMQVHSETYRLFSNVSYWARYSKDKVLNVTEMSRDYAAIFITPSNPVLDIKNRIEYFRYSEDDHNWSWNDNIGISTSDSRYVMYTIDLINMDEESCKLVFHPSDDLNHPQIVDALPSIITVDPSRFDEAKTDEDKEVFDSSYSRNSQLNSRIPQWTWEIIPGPNRDPSSPSSLEVKVKPEITSITNTSVYQPGILFSRKVIRFNFTGVLVAGDTLRVKFIAPVTADEVDDTKSTINDAYGYNGNGTMVAYISPDQSDNVIGIGMEIDDYDLNGNGKVDDRYIKVGSRGISFVTSNDLRKVKKAFTNLDQSGTSKIDAAPATEGSTYTYSSTIINTMGDKMAAKHPVILDILPYPGDSGILNDYQRGTVWSGWLLPETIRLEETGEGSAGLIPEDKYDVWVGPFKKSGNNISFAGINNLPPSDTRKHTTFYREISATSGDSKLRNTYNFIKLSELMSLKTSNYNQYEALRKQILAVYVQMKDRNYTLQGQKNLVLSYDMQAPMNVPFLLGKQFGNNFEPFTSWNSFATWSTSVANPSESNASGVFVNQPEGKVTLGNYIWYDTNGNGQQDELPTIIGANGRELADITQGPDPGINGIQVELLTKEGYLADEHGNGLVQVPGDSSYYIADENGEPYVDPYDVQLKGGTPVVFTTTSDYEGRNGYYILANITPGEYKLRFTFPKENKYYGLTTMSTHNGLALNAGVTSGSNGTLVIVTDAFRLETNKPDAEYMDFDLGVRLPVRYGGTVWLDEYISSTAMGKNGKMDFPPEEKIEGATIRIFTENGVPAIDMLGNEMVTVSDANGKFSFDHMNVGQRYYAEVIYNDEDQGYPTPFASADPLSAGNDNDLRRAPNGKNRTAVFTTNEPMENGAPAYTDSSKTSYKLVDKLGMGFVPLGESMISGILWDDRNRNGLREDNEDGIEGSDVTIERFIYFDNTWTLDDTFVRRSVKSGQGGAYYFDGVDGVSPEGHLYGYKIFMEDLPEEYTTTILHADSDSMEEFIRKALDSDLYDDGVIYDGTITNPYSERLIIIGERRYGEWVADPTIIYGLDAGVVSFAKGSISGMAGYQLEEVNMKHLAPGLKIRLEARLLDTNDYYPVVWSADKKNVLAYGMDGYSTANEPYEVITDDSGNYIFAALPPGDPRSRVPFEYRAAAEKPDFAEWSEDADSMIIDGINAYSEDITLVDDADGTLYGYDFFYAKQSENNNFHLIYPKPSRIEGTIYLDSNLDGIPDDTELLEQRMVTLYRFDSFSGTWVRHTDLTGRNSVSTDKNGHYSFLVNSAELDLRKENLMEQQKYRLVFRKQTKELFAAGGDVNLTSDSGLSEAELTQLQTNYLTSGISVEVVFGTVSLSDPIYGGRDVLQKNTAEEVKVVDCEVIDPVDGRIQGTVWYDANQNGMKDALETGAAGRKVYLYQWNGTKYALAADRNGNSFVEADADGKYEFIVDAGVYDTAERVLELQKYFVVFEKDITEYFTEAFEGADSIAYPMDELDTIPGLNEEGAAHIGINYAAPKNEIKTADIRYDDVLEKDVYDPETVVIISQINCGLLPHKTASISGSIWNDSNRNGRYDAEEIGAEAKRAIVYKLNPESGIWEEYAKYNSSRSNKLTDADGRFTFDVDALNYDMNSAHLLQPNLYRVVFEKAISGEFFTKPFAGSDPKYYSHGQTLEDLAEEIPGIRLDDTKAVTDVISVVATGGAIVSGGAIIYDEDKVYNQSDFLEVEDINCGLVNEPTSVIEGRIWHDRNEDGVQDPGEGLVAGEEVSLFIFDEYSNTWKLIQDLTGQDTILTGNDGSYRFTVDPAHYDKDSERYLQPKKYRVLLNSKYAQAFSPAYIGDDEYKNSDGLAIDSFTPEELEALQEIEMTEKSLVTDEIKFANSKYDPYLGRDIIDFAEIKAQKHIDFGVIRHIFRDYDEEEVVTLEIEPDLDISETPDTEVDNTVNIFKAAEAMVNYLRTPPLMSSSGNAGSSDIIVDTEAGADLFEEEEDIVTEEPEEEEDETETEEEESSNEHGISGTMNGEQTSGEADRIPQDVNSGSKIERGPAAETPAKQVPNDLFTFGAAVGGTTIVAGIAKATSLFGKKRRKFKK